MLITLLKNYWLFILVGLISIFLPGLMNKYIPEFRLVKIAMYLLLISFITSSLIVRSNRKHFLKFVILNTLFLFLVLQFSNYFTFLLIQHSKYLEAPLFSTGFGFLAVIIYTYVFSGIGMVINTKTQANFN